MSIESRVAVLEEQNRTGKDFHKEVGDAVLELQLASVRMEGKLDEVLKPRSKGKQGFVAGGLVAAIAAISVAVTELARVEHRVTGRCLGRTEP